MDVLKQLKQGRGRGGSSGRTRGGSRGRGARGGRGRGRGRGNNSISRAVEVIDLDDGDDICNMALANVELENNSLMQSFEELNNAVALDGYDEISAGNIWIYPINRAIRDYQYDIVKTALFNNTLVSLPTGLGKTFISAVVMYNFSRWYPSGIVVFMAPTRPLVAQQLDACHNTVGIDKSRTVELTGHIPAKKREQLWKNKTVFFLTPQVMLSDIERNFFPLENVRCVVVDEAHKALGNHSYVQVISKIIEKNRLFRVLALTATPGSDLAAVQQVFKNLLISRVELRSENSPDILPYIHDKKKEVHVVRLLGYVKEVYDKIVEIFQEYSGKLMKANALVGRSGAAYSKFQLLKARESFRGNLGQKLPNYQKGYIEIDFNICISLAHSIEILNSHGLRTFSLYLLGVLNNKKGTPAVRSELRKNEALNQLVEELQTKLNISIDNSTFDFDVSNTSALYSTVGSPNTSAMFARSFMKNDDVDYTLSHPKLTILKDVVEKHFLDYKTRNDTTRVIIFSQYRDSVQEIGNMLNSLRPMVKPMIFIGKANTGTLGPGLKQKDQIRIVDQFRDGDFNVLVATSVGEEGLDIGEVDLIVCFDASRSPTRLIQRMGRTGRQRDGRTVFLLTSGKEERSYATSIQQHSNISKTITDPNQLEPFLYKKSPRMVPLGIDLSCYKMEINLPSEQQTQPKRLMDIEEDDNYDSEVKTKSKPIPGKSKKKKAPAKEKAVKGPSIAKLFERIKSSQEPPAKKTKAEYSCPREVLEPITERIPDVALPRHQDDDVYFVEDDIHMFAMEPGDAFSRSSVISSIFDMESKERTEWTPCTTFYKKDMPSTKAVSRGITSSGLDILLDFKELLNVERSIKNRQSFSYVNKDFCECGNTLDVESEDCVVEWSNIDNPCSPTSKGDSSKNTSATYFSESMMQHSLQNSNSSTDFSEPVVHNSRVHSSSTTDFSEPVEPQISVIENNKNAPILNRSSTPIRNENKNNDTPDYKRHANHSGKTSHSFSFKRKQPENHCKDDQNQSHATFNQYLHPLPPNRISVARISHPTTPSISFKSSQTRSPSPVTTKIDKSQCHNMSAKAPLHQNQYATSPNISTYKKSSSSTNVYNSIERHPSPPHRIFDRHLPKTHPKFSYKQNPAHTPSIPITPVKENFSDEDSIYEFPPSPNADVSSNPFVEEFKKRKAENAARLFKEPRNSFSVESKAVAIDDARDNVDDASHVQENVVEEIDLADSFSDEDDNFGVFENQPVVHQDIIPVNRSQSRKPSPSKHNEIDVTETSSEGYGTGRSKFKFKKRQSKPLIESPRMTTVDESNAASNTTTSNLQQGDFDEFHEYCELFGSEGDYLGGTEPQSFYQESVEDNSPVSRSPSLSPNQYALNTTSQQHDKPTSKFKMKRHRSNPFIESQAAVTDDEVAGSSDSTGDHEELDDSFVDQDNDNEITESQQVMYVKSLRDVIPARFGRVERPLSPKLYGTAMDTSEEGYDVDDSFCQEDDEVDYSDVGVFTQAMNQAKVDLASGSSSGTRYQTRRAKKAEGSSSGKTSSGKSNSQSKQRRRIISYDTSSDEG